MFEIVQFGKLKKKFTIWKINILQFVKLLNVLNVQFLISQIAIIDLLGRRSNVRNCSIWKIKKKFTIWKIIILQFVKLLNVLNVQIIYKK